MLLAGYRTGDLRRAYASIPDEIGRHRIKLQTYWYGTGNDVTKVTGHFRHVYSGMK